MADVGKCPGCGRTKCFANPGDKLCPSCRTDVRLDLGTVRVRDGEVQSVKLAACLEDCFLEDGTWQIELIARKAGIRS
jgi:hypothetical protein